MSDDDPLLPSPADKAERDGIRIEAEIAGLDEQTDPFVAAVRATRMPMIITNPRLPDNPVVFANDAFCRLSGYPREEILGRNCRFLQGPDSDRETVAKIRDAVDRAEPIEIDVLNYRKNGETFWNRLLLAPVYDAEQQLAYFFASQVDVTIERERLEGLENDNAALMTELTDRLRLQEERERELAFALKAGRFGTWSIDMSSRTLTASDACKAIFGISPDQIFTYEDRMAAIHPEDRTEAEAGLDRSASDGSVYDVTYRIRTPAGEQRWIASRGQAYFSPEGEALRMAGVSIDVTAPKRAERMRDALAELNDLFRDMDDAADISFAAAEILGRALQVSRAGYGIVHHEREQIVIERDWNAPGVETLAGTLSFRDYGSYIEDLKRGETVVIEDARLDPRTQDSAAALEAITARSFVNMPLTEQGGTVALLYVNHAEPRHFPEDEIDFMREVAERTRSATERRRAERELDALNASLEQQVADRTRELLAAEEALRQSQKMEAVGQLTGGIAHDFNNLLTGIGGSLEMLQSRVAQGRLTEVDKYVTAAQGAVRRAAALTHRLLAFSRRQTLDPRPTDVNRLVSGMEELVRRTVGPSIEVESALKVGLWPTLVDPGQLENALLNLCINARDAMPDGGKLTIETANRWMDDRLAREQDLEPGQYVSLCVSDTGTGMTPEVMEKAFDPFFTTKPIGQGTGLGLSMIYGFARQSGGQVRIYSEVGQGTNICIYLPRHRGGDAISEEAEAPYSASHRGGGETVLIVDDEPAIRMLVTDVLADLGYNALEAPDGAAGLRILNSDVRIDLLITDVGLPGGMNGRQVADGARAVRPDLKVLFITGYAENAVLSHGHLDHGMHVLTKPFPMEVLADRIRDLIQGQPGA